MGELVDLDLYRRKRRRRHTRPRHAPAPSEAQAKVPGLPQPVQAPRLESPNAQEGGRTGTEPVVLAPKERDDPSSA